MAGLKQACNLKTVCVCVCWKCVYSIYAVVYAELTVSSPWWSTHTQPALLSALVKCRSPCPRFRFFHQKRKWKHSLLARGREGSGQLVVEAGEKRVGEREKGEQGHSHLDLLYGHFHWRKSREGTLLDLLVGGGGQGGDSKQKGSKRRCWVSHDTNSSKNKYGSYCWSCF